MEITARKNRTVVRSRNLIRLTRAALQTAFIVSDDLGASLAERLFTSPRRHPRPPRERAVLASARELTVDVTLRSPHHDARRANAAADPDRPRANAPADRDVRRTVAAGRDDVRRIAGRRHDTRRTIAAWRWGYGPTVLLVHGWEGRGSQLGALVEPLVAAGMSVVAFDAPGHGDSPGDRLYLTDLADCVADVAAAVGPLHAIVAHSFGAAAVLLAHARAGVTAPRNIMIAPNVLLDESLAQFSRTVGLDDTDRASLVDRLAAHTGLDPSQTDLVALARARSDALLVIHDRDDHEVAPAQGACLAEHWPGAELAHTTGLGHRRVLRDAAVIAQTVEFARVGVPLAVSDLVREVDRYLDGV